MKRLLLPLSMLLTATNMWGIDVYFYTDGDVPSQVHDSQEVRSIELGTEQTVVHRMDFTSTALSNTDFSHMLFRSKKLSGASLSREERTGISVTLSGSLLTVAAPASLDLVEITAANGIKAATLGTPASVLTFDMASLADGIYVIRIQAGEQVCTTKIIKKQ